MSNERVTELETEIGQRGSAAINAAKRSALRSWLQIQAGVTAAAVIPLGTAALGSIYNDTTGALLERFKLQGAGAFGAAVPTAPLATNGNADSVAQKLAEALALLKVSAGVDEEAVRKIAAEEASKVTAPERVVVIDKRAKEERRADVGVQHYAFPLLLKALEAGLHVALVGPAGTGKTTAAHAVSKALGLDYEAQSFCATTTKSDLLGFVDANGNYRDTSFRRAFVNGGVWLGDEFDAGNANANVVINAALANGVCSFPDGMRSRHEKNLIVLAMNTYGQGANRQYVGRNQLDAATMDRLAFIDWDLDPALEGAMLGVKRPVRKLDISEGGSMTPGDWLSRVERVREAVLKTGVRHLVTPRASKHGAILFAAGVGRKHVEEMVLWKGLDAEQRARVESQAGK